MSVDFQVISAEQVYQVCAWDKLVAALAAGHAGEKPLVDRVALERQDCGVTETFINIPAWLPGRAFCSKIITVLPGNPQRDPGTPAVQALVTLFDGETGSPRAVIDGTSLTYVKTAADSALGSQLLSREGARTLTLAGTGGLAPYAVRAHLAVRPQIETVFVWGRRSEQAMRTVSELSRNGIPAQPVDDLEGAVRAADIVTCVTASHEPVVSGDWLRPGAHLDLIGAFTPQMRECDDAAVVKARLFVDSRWFAIEETGDLGSPLECGVITHDDIEADLFELCSGGYHVNRKREDITLFKNGGGGHLDLFTAMFIAGQLETNT